MQAPWLPVATPNLGFSCAKEKIPILQDPKKSISKQKMRDFGFCSNMYSMEVITLVLTAKES